MIGCTHSSYEILQADVMLILPRRPPWPDYPNKLRIGAREALFERGWATYSTLYDEFEVVEEMRAWLYDNVRGFTAHAVLNEDRASEGHITPGTNLDFFQFVYSFEYASDMVLFKLRWF